MRLWTVTREGAVVVAEYHRGGANYVVDAAVEELAGIARSLRGDDAARCLVLTGRSGEPFITHFDPEQILQGVLAPETVVRRGPVRNAAVGELFGVLSSLPFPVVAALSGDAMGFGFELALACDLRIGQSGDALYGLPEVRLGIIPGAGGTQRLVRLIGFDRAFDIVVRGRALSPEAALAAGIVTEVVADARARALELGHEFAGLPPVAVAVAKRALHAGVDAPLSAALTIESDASVRAKLAPEARDHLEEYVSMSPSQRREWLKR